MYSLLPNVESANTQSSVSTYAVIGEENRVSANGLNENTGIVYLKSKYSTGAVGSATGFIVGNHIIATAAHCVYDKGTSTRPADFFQDITIETYGTDGKLTGKKLTPVEAHVSQDYISTKDFHFDYAMITVKEDLSDYFHFNLGSAYEMKPDKFTNIPIYVTGCPSYLYYVSTGNYNSDKELYTGEGRIARQGHSALYYNTDTSKGDSGSPVYTLTKSKTGSSKEVDIATVIAIHSGQLTDGSANRASLITNYHLQFYENNPNINY